MTNYRSKFDQELKSLIDDIITMSTNLESTIDKTIKAIQTKDGSLAQQIIDNDDYFDEFERRIERESVSIISRQQPVASDLRAVFAIIKIVTDLERIADHCEDISRYVLGLVKHEYVVELDIIPEMAEIVKQMVRLTVDSFIEQDAIKAKRVLQSDDIVDDYHEKLYNKTKQLIMQQPDKSEQLVDFIMVSKYLERMADHATNVAEWVIYIVEGKWFIDETNQ